MKIDFSLSDLPEPTTEFEQKVLLFVEDWFSDAKTVRVQTSGSTGIPKVFHIEKKKMLHSAKTTCDILKLEIGDSALLCLPIEYISGKMMVVRAIERGLKLVLITPSSNPLEDLNDTDFVDFCAMSPLQVEKSVEKIHLIKNLIIGGAAVSENLKAKIYKVSNLKPKTNSIFETYGMSETLSHIALKEIYPDANDYFSVLNGIQISLDKRGCLTVDAPNLNPEILQTNDLVEIRNDHQFKYLGRIDNIINSGGAKISPEELEVLVKKNIANEAVFIGIPDEILGEKLILVIESDGSDQTKISNQLLAVKYQQKFHHPKETIFIKSFPRLANGKINRREILNLLK